MLVRCNPKCKLNDGMTECKLNVETNQAMCLECGDEIAVSEFAKKSMKSNDDVIKNVNKRAFMFKCETCDTMVHTMYKNSKLCGTKCEKPDKCIINITESMKAAVKQFGEEDEQTTK